MRAALPPDGEHLYLPLPVQAVPRVSGELSGQELEFTGTYARAELLDIPEDAQPHSTVCHWLMYAPFGSPGWQQYVLVGLSLAEVPGVPSAVKSFPEATHEIMVLALDPRDGPYTRESMRGYARTGDLPYLTPGNVSWQFTGTDDETQKLCALAARAVVMGILSPEPPLSGMKHFWHSELDSTLRHVRGEPH